MTEPVTVICMKWRTRYSAQYVNRLHNGVHRNLKRPFRFICFTDDEQGLDSGIETHPLPDISLPEAFTWTPWRKVSVWQYPLADIEGDVLFLDLDLVITGALDPMFEYEPGEFCVIENWTQSGEEIGNTSVFRFRAGNHHHIFDRFQKDPLGILSTHRIEQQYISTSLPGQKFWPANWCLSFKHNLVPKFPDNWIKPPSLPDEAKVVVFTGRPDIDEAATGRWPAPWFKKFYKHAKPAVWIKNHWNDEKIGG